MPGSFRSHMTRAALLCSVVLLAPLAMADTPAPSSPAAAPASHEPTRDEMRARHHADHEAFLAARLAALHAGLQLKPEQETLWAPVETAIRDFGKLHAWGPADHSTSPTEQPKSVSATDELKAQADRLIARGNAMKSLADASGPLLASLSPEQKGRLPMLLDGLNPRRVLARAFGIDNHSDDREAWHHGEHEGWGHGGMRHEHWAEHGMREHEGRDGADHRAERSDRDDEGHGFEHRRHAHHGWDEHAERDGMRGDDRGPVDEPMHHHRDHDQDEDGPDRT